MNTTNNHTMQLIADFLETYSCVFGVFLDQKGFKPSEAEVIAADLRQAFAIDRNRAVIDRKFIVHAYNPVNHKHYTQADAILLCAKDRAVPAALHAYQAECMRLGANEEHVRSVGLLISRVLDYQIAIENRIPDTVGDEIPRCLFGDGI